MVADARHGADALVGRLREGAGHEVHLVVLGEGDDGVRIRNAGGGENLGVVACGLDDRAVHALARRERLFGIALDNGDVRAARHKRPRELYSGEPGTYDNCLHDSSPFCQTKALYMTWAVFAMLDEVANI